MTRTRGYDDYVRRAQELLGEIDGDESISDFEYVELMDEIAGDAESRADAKREELKRTGDDL